MYFHQNAARRTTALSVVFYFCVIFYPSYGSLLYIYKGLQTDRLFDLIENIAVAASFLYMASLHVIYYTLQDRIIGCQVRLEKLYQSYNSILSLQMSRLWINAILMIFLGINIVASFSYYAMYNEYKIVVDYVCY